MPKINQSSIESGFAGRMNSRNRNMLTDQNIERTYESAGHAKITKAFFQKYAEVSKNADLRILNQAELNNLSIKTLQLFSDMFDSKEKLSMLTGREKFIQHYGVDPLKALQESIAKQAVKAPNDALGYTFLKLLSAQIDAFIATYEEKKQDASDAKNLLRQAESKPRATETKSVTFTTLTQKTETSSRDLGATESTNLGETIKREVRKVEKTTITTVTTRIIPQSIEKIPVFVPRMPSYEELKSQVEDILGSRKLENADQLVDKLIQYSKTEKDPYKALEMLENADSINDAGRLNKSLYINTESSKIQRRLGAREI